MKVRSVVTMRRDTQGKVNLAVHTFRGNHKVHRYFDDIGFNRGVLISNKVAYAQDRGMCTVHPITWTPVGWEARFGFVGR